ncbi:hypothetical protein [Paenibacillus wenxiniae]|uniref:Uncharacterized protein n=1 Tax=Paenibacillus wenxiniae TaxID=1636843 RepID=A0ABW4RH14_9BACL
METNERMKVRAAPVTMCFWHPVHQTIQQLAEAKDFLGEFTWEVLCYDVSYFAASLFSVTMNILKSGGTRYGFEDSK